MEEDASPGSEDPCEYGWIADRQLNGLFEQPFRVVKFHSSGCTRYKYKVQVDKYNVTGVRAPSSSWFSERIKTQTNVILISYSCEKNDCRFLCCAPSYLSSLLSSVCRSTVIIVSM